MVSNKRKCCKSIKILAAILVLVLSLGLIACESKDYVKEFNENFFNLWDVTLPDNMEKIFSKSEDTFYGDGIRYAVFKLSQEPTDLISDFKQEKDEEMETAVNQYLTDAKFSVPKKYLPDWTVSYYWKHIEIEFLYNSSDHCYIIYFPDSLKFAVCQFIS